MRALSKFNSKVRLWCGVSFSDCSFHFLVCREGVFVGGVGQDSDPTRNVSSYSVLSSLYRLFHVLVPCNVSPQGINGLSRQ